MPTESDVLTLAEESYRSQVQTEYVEARMSEMTKNQTVEKIDGAWENLESFHE